MLAGETAVGTYPAKAIQILDLVLRDAEQMPPPRVPLEEAHVRAPHGQAICEAAVTLAERGHAAAIVAVTRGGKTAALLSALRPATTIVAATDQAAGVPAAGAVVGRAAAAWPTSRATSTWPPGASARTLVGARHRSRRRPPSCS